MQNNDVFLTGCTGLLGRHILYELIGMSQFKGNIYVLMRNGKGGSLSGNLEKLLSEPSIPRRYKSLAQKYLLQGRIIPLHGDLSNPEKLSHEISRTAVKHGKLVVIHAAGSVNLSNNERARTEVYKFNHKGTMNLLSVLKNRIDRFVHLSTAFSIGKVKGVVSDEFKKINKSVFRNPYEECKRVTESTLIEMAEREKWKLTIVRPSIICGRLHNPPLFFTSKFDVFYSWVKFFWRLSKHRNYGNIRILTDKNSWINIVPVDFVAKATCVAWVNDIRFLNAVNPIPIRTRIAMSIALNEIKFTNYEFVDKKPTNLNKWEQYYYSSVGSVFEQYVDGSNVHYDTSKLISLMPDIALTDIHQKLAGLIGFANKNDFGDRKIT